MWENSNCYNCNQSYFGKSCYGEQEQHSCCKKTEEDSCCYYPNYWQVESEQSEGKFKHSCCKRPKFNGNTNENYFENYGQENYYAGEENIKNNQCSCSKNNWGYTEQKQCFKPKKRCCFCDLFNCICGRR